MFSRVLAALDTDEQRNTLTSLYERYKDRFYSIALSRLHDLNDAADAVQEALLRVVDKPEKFLSLPDNKKIPYIDVIIRNVAVDMYREKQKIISGEGLLNAPPNDDIPVEDFIIGEISSAEVAEYIDTLPDAQLNALTLYCFVGLSLAETAETLGISLAATKKRIYNARVSINKFLREREGNIINE